MRMYNEHDPLHRRFRSVDSVIDPLLLRHHGRNRLVSPYDRNGNEKPLPSIPYTESVEVQYNTSSEESATNLINRSFEEIYIGRDNVKLYLFCIFCMDKALASIPFELKSTLDKSISQSTCAGPCIMLTICSSCDFDEQSRAIKDHYGLFRNMEMPRKFLMDTRSYDCVTKTHPTLPYIVGTHGGVACVPAKDIYKALSKNCRIHTLEEDEDGTYIKKRMCAGFF